MSLAAWWVSGVVADCNLSTKLLTHSLDGSAGWAEGDEGQRIIFYYHLSRIMLLTYMEGLIAEHYAVGLTHHCGA